MAIILLFSELSRKKCNPPTLSADICHPFVFPLPFVFVAYIKAVAFATENTSATASVRE